MTDVVMGKIEAMQRRMISNAGARRRALDANYKRAAATASATTDTTPTAAADDAAPAPKVPVKA